MTAYTFHLEYESAYAPKLLFATLMVASLNHARLLNSIYDESGLTLIFDKDISQAEIVRFMSTL